MSSAQIDNEIIAPLVRQISWSNNILILGATKTIEEKEFYIKMCIKNNYTKRELDRQIGSGYYQRYMLSGGKANQSIAKIENEIDYPKLKPTDFFMWGIERGKKGIEDFKTKIQQVNNLFKEVNNSKEAEKNR